MNKKNVTTFLLILLIAASFVLACKRSSGAVNSNVATGNDNGITNDNENASPQPVGPPVRISYGELMSEFSTNPQGAKEKYKGRELIVTGKLWDVSASSYDGYMRLSERGGFVITCLGDFGNSTYERIQTRISDLKSTGNTDKLPTVTVDGLFYNGETTYITMSKCALTGAQK